MGDYMKKVHELLDGAITEMSGFPSLFKELVRAHPDLKKNPHFIELEGAFKDAWQFIYDARKEL
jgi:hypothetical protein